MLEAMRNLALCHLWNELEEQRSPPDDLSDWFLTERRENGGRFFPFLVEPAGKIETFYVLSADTTDHEVAVLSPFELGSIDGNPASCLPFNKPSGPQSPQLGPVIKRTYDKAKGASPSPKILNSTLAAFRQIVEDGKCWAKYFQEVVDVWSRPKVKFGSGLIATASGESAFQIAVRTIPETSKTVFLTFRDAVGRLPGEVPEYVSYLSSVLAKTKYASGKVPPAPISRCPQCGRENVIGYASACSGAGLNIANVDRPGAFSNIDIENAPLNYALCVDCADLLYIFKFSVMNNVTANIAHEKALILPHLHMKGEALQKSSSVFLTYADGLGNELKQTKSVSLENRQLLRALAENRAVTSLDIIWAEFGQALSNLRGQISDVLPSRLRNIHKMNGVFYWQGLAFAPRFPLDGFIFDLQLSFLHPLLKRPGGNKAKSVNASKNLFEVRRAVAAAIYSAEKIPETRFWDETMRTAQWFLNHATESESADFDVLYEGHSEKKGSTWLTLAGWVRHLAVALEYFRYMNVINKEDSMRTFEPTCEKLKPFFGEDGGINSDEKAFAFILGLLYGRVMMIQGKRGVNVGANALTWLKRLTLSGDDLPDLFVKVREKLLAYEAERSELVRQVIAEVAKLGCALGNSIKLDQTACCYFLLLGQAMSVEVFKKEETDSDKDKDEN